jgi:hypothetical protein
MGSVVNPASLRFNALELKLVALWVLVLALLLGACALPEERAPPPEATSADVVRLAEPVPEHLAQASRQAFEGGARFFIWRDSDETVRVPGGAVVWVPVHFAIAPGTTTPQVFMSQVLITARDKTSRELKTIASLASKQSLSADVGLANVGSSFSGEGTVEASLVEVGLTAGPALSNTLRIRVDFGS